MKRIAHAVSPNADTPCASILCSLDGSSLAKEAFRCVHLHPSAPADSVICQNTCPLGTLYGLKSSWTHYGKKSWCEFIQVRPAQSTAEFEKAFVKTDSIPLLLVPRLRFAHLTRLGYIRYSITQLNCEVNSRIQ